MINEIEIPIPLTSEKEIDSITQAEIANKQEKINQVKTYLVNELDRINNIMIDFV